MNHRNTLHTTCPSCRLSFELSADNIRQADFKRKFKKYDYVTKSSIENVLADEGLESDTLDDQETEAI